MGRVRIDRPSITTWSGVTLSRPKARRIASTLAIGKPGAINAALLAASIVAVNHPEIRERLRAFRAEQTNAVLAQPDPASE